MKKHAFILISFACLLSSIQAQNIINVKDINVNSSGSYPFDFTIANNKLFFLAQDDISGYSLWVTTGSGSNTKKLSPANPGVTIADIIAYNNKIYFSYDDGLHGYELWVSDGTRGGTILFKDLYPGITGSYPQAFTVANNKLFFMGSGVNGERRLYVSDGTIAGTKIIRDYFINIFNGMTDFAVLNNDIYFSSSDDAGNAGLWKSNGTTAGTKVVKTNFSPGVTGCNYAVLNNQLYFSGFDYTNGSELWVTGGTAGSTHLVKNLRADGGGILNGGNPNNLIVYNNRVYFGAQDDAHGYELFSTNGTAAGTQLVKDIVPGTAGSLPYGSIVFKNLLYFVCINTQQLWKTDGTIAGTKLVKGGLHDARIGNQWKNKLYLVVDNDYRVWESNGTSAGTKVLQPDNTGNPVYSLNNGFQFLEYKTELYFSGSSYPVTLGYELCKLTTASSLLSLGDITPGALQTAHRITANFTALYNAANKEIIINNDSQINCNWKLFSINGGLLKQGRSTAAIINIATTGIAAGTYFLVCASSFRTEKIQLAIY